MMIQKTNPRTAIFQLRGVVMLLGGMVWGILTLRESIESLTGLSLIWHWIGIGAVLSMVFGFWLIFIQKAQKYVTLSHLLLCVTPIMIEFGSYLYGGINRISQPRGSSLGGWVGLIDGSAFNSLIAEVGNTLPGRIVRFLFATVVLLIAIAIEASFVWWAWHKPKTKQQ